MRVSALLDLDFSPSHTGIFAFGEKWEGNDSAMHVLS